MTLGQAYALMVLAVIAGSAIYHSGLTVARLGWAALLRWRQLARIRHQLLGMVAISCPACTQPMWRHDPMLLQGGAFAKCPGGHQAVPMWVLAAPVPPTAGRN